MLAAITPRPSGKTRSSLASFFSHALERTLSRDSTARVRQCPNPARVVAEASLTEVAVTQIGFKGPDSSRPNPLGPTNLQIAIPAISFPCLWRPVFHWIPFLFPSVFSESHPGCANPPSNHCNQTVSSNKVPWTVSHGIPEAMDLSRSWAIDVFPRCHMAHLLFWRRSCSLVSS